MNGADVKGVRTTAGSDWLEKVPAIRWVVQAVYTLFYVLVGFEFYLFYRGVVTAGTPAVSRPPAVEGFLPISSLLGLRYFIQTGNWDYVHPAGLTIILAVIISAFLTRKSFCAWVCPVGAVSRIFENLGGRLIKKKWRMPRVLDHLLMSVKYLLLGFFVYVIFFKMSISEVEAFIRSPYNVAADAKMLIFFADMSKTTAIVLSVLVVFSILVKNFWCRYLCPYGAFLGVISLVSPVRITRDENTCISCEKCTDSCPYQIRVHEKRSVSTPECTACLNCVTVCPVEGCLQVKAFRKRISPYAVPALLLAVILSFYVFARATGKWETRVPPEVIKRTYSIAERLQHPR